MIKKIINIALLSFAINAYAGNSITSIDLAEDTLTAAIKPNGTCLHYQIPTHFCIWFDVLDGKSVTPVLNHYLPDLVVVVYRNKNENPWIEARALLDNISSNVQSSLIKNVGSGDHSFLSNHENNVIFKEADVIGNPGLLVLQDRIGGVLLKSNATPAKPYFQSMLDSFLWRGMMPESLPEETAAIGLNLTHNIAAGLNDWGGLYPHEGTVQGFDDAKASMVIAQRATDLLTGNAFAHIHQSLSNSCGSHCKVSPVTENSQETLFQLVYPIEENDCYPLGSDQSYRSDMLNDQGAYVWIVWRHYQGCADGDGTYIGET